MSGGSLLLRVWPTRGTCSERFAWSGDCLWDGRIAGTEASIFGVPAADPLDSETSVTSSMDALPAVALTVSMPMRVKSHIGMKNGLSQPMGQRCHDGACRMTWNACSNPLSRVAG